MVVDPGPEHDTADSLARGFPYRSSIDYDSRVSCSSFQTDCLKILSLQDICYLTQT